MRGSGLANCHANSAAASAAASHSSNVRIRPRVFVVVLPSEGAPVGAERQGKDARARLAVSLEAGIRRGADLRGATKAARCYGHDVLTALVARAALAAFALTG